MSQTSSSVLFSMRARVISAACAILAIGSVSSDAFGGPEYCPDPLPDMMCKGRGKCEPASDPNRTCSNKSVGDPVDIIEGFTHQATRDLEIHTSLGDIGFDRYYSSRESAWSYRFDNNGLPAPFGQASPDSDHSGMWWWHGFYSYVFERLDGQGDILAVTHRLYSGSLREYDACIPPPGSSTCLLDPKSENGSERNLLQKIPSGYAFYEETTRRRYIYTKAWDTAAQEQAPGTHYFLTEIQDANYHPIAHVEYSTPTVTGGQCPLFTEINGDLPDAGPPPPGASPYISRVVSADGQSFEFVYTPHLNSNSHTECVLSRVDLSSSSGIAASVSFTYPDTQVHYPVSMDGRITSAHIEEHGTTTHHSDYSYFDSSQNSRFQDIESGFVRVNHSYGASATSCEHATAISGPFESMSIDYGSVLSTACSPDSPPATCDGADPLDRAVTMDSAGSGDGTNTSPGFTQTYTVANSWGSYHAGRVYQVVDDCGTSPACSNGSRRYEWSASDAGLPGHEWATKDKRDDWIVSTFDWPSPDAGVPDQMLERKSVMWGVPPPSTGLPSEDPNTNGAKLVENYGYGYGPNAEQHMTSRKRSVILGIGGTGYEETVRYVGNRVEAVFREGNTLDLGGTTSHKIYATFYKTSRTCDPGSADPLDRTLAVRGPCEVADTNATDCSGSFPITEYTYYPAASPANASSNRLAKVAKFPAGCAPSNGNRLEWLINAWTEDGNPSSVTDPSGVTTTYSWLDGKLATAVIDGSYTYQVLYDHGEIKAVRKPAGNYEVFCHRVNSAGQCDENQNFDTRVQWRAKASDALGANWSEREEYSWWADGTLREARTYEPSGQAYPNDKVLRRVRKYSADAHGRPTWQGFGESTLNGPPVFTAKSAFDPADNRVGVGLPFNQPPDFCKDQPLQNSPVSELCAAMTYDSADRLTSVTEYPAQNAAAIRSCFDYDEHGNIKSVQTGCTACDSSCTQPKAEYLYDDFDRLIRVRLPNTSNGSGGLGEFHYEYDAMGNVVRRDTPEMKSVGTWFRMAYDQLGRLLGSYKASASDTIGSPLYEFAWDENVLAGTSCGDTVRTKGRLRQRRDSFGSTWYSYDVRGLVSEELRARNGNCVAASHSDGNPNTEFAYDMNGNLTQITYPHGRVVNYDFPPYSDRADTIRVTFSTGTAAVVTNIKWEPYGDLRSYVLADPTASSTVATVEYAAGGGLESTPTLDCSALPSGNDATGRTGALLVSTGSISGGSGDIFKRLYTWQGDQIVAQDTCVLSTSGTPERERFTYDRLLRLTSASATEGVPGSFTSRTYDLDARGNITSYGLDSSAFSTAYAGGNAPDQLTHRQDGTTNSGDPLFAEDYSYDLDGRMSMKVLPSSIPYAPRYPPPSPTRYFFDYAVAPDRAGADTVFKGVCKDSGGYSACWSYYYDAFNRRRLKMTATSLTEEYFYGDENHLLEDRGNTSTFGGAPYPIDEYIWLGGRPVAFVRSTMDSTMTVRDPDLSGTCMRDDEPTPCGIYFMVTDHIGKPVAMLDTHLSVAGIGQYDPYGHVNRVTRHATTPPNFNFQYHWAYPNNLGSMPGGQAMNGYNISTYSASTMGGMQTRIRARLRQKETESCDFGNGLKDFAYFGSGGFELGNPRIGGANDGDVWSSWLNSSYAEVDFYSDSTTPDPQQPRSCYSTPAQCGGMAQWCPNASSWDPVQQCVDCQYPYAGIQLAGFEYQQWQSTLSTPVWTPLRFPGQYYDPETDLFENWNRYYDPGTGRYLQPEPMGQTPEMALSYAKRALAVGYYQYSAGNPVANYDPDGLKFKNASPGVRKILDDLESDPNIGPRIKEMDEAENVEISFEEKSCNDMLGQGGGNTDLELGPRGGVDRFFVTYNIEAAQSTMAAAFHLSESLDQLLAHELGHVDADMRGIAPGTRNNQNAVDWENARRGNGPFRPRHNPNACIAAKCAN